MPAFNYKYPRPAPGKNQEGTFFKKGGGLENDFFSAPTNETPIQAKLTAVQPKKQDTKDKKDLQQKDGTEDKQSPSIPNVQLQAGADDPRRADAIHQTLFSNFGGGGAPRTPWVEPTSADQIVAEFKANFGEHPAIIIPQNTTEGDAETDAIRVDERIRITFSDITSAVSESRLRDSVQIMDDSFFQDDQFRRAWLANEMVKVTNIENFDISESDPRYRAVQDRLFADSDVGDDIENKMRKISAFAQEDEQNPAADREIFLNQGISPASRVKTLIHEIIHFYAHPQFKEWINQSTAVRVYNEGMTEHFARQVMTSTELANRTSYQDRVEAVRNDILAFSSEDDMRKAFFKGEVWRLEHTSDEAKEAFGDQIGIQSDATRDEEKAQSLTSPGIVQTVENNRRFRFMNLGIASADPKAEHQAFLQNILTMVVQPNSALRIRFVGHTSSTGSMAYNRELSRRRVNAFYQLARDAGIPDSQLINADNPEFEGEVSGTSDNESVIGRAMNRRVELYIVPPVSTQVEDNVFHLERLRGEGVEDDGFSATNDFNNVARNSPNPEGLLPYNAGGWDSTLIMTQLGQHDIMGGTDSDALRCVQAVAMASYIPGGPDSVESYLRIIIQEANRTRRINARRRKAIEVINFVRSKLTSRTATFGDLSWAQESVHDLFFDDVSGTDANEILNQISPNLDPSRASTAMDVWTNSSAELMTALQGLQPGEQLVVNHWKVLFDEAYEDLRGRGIPTRSPMQVNVRGRNVTIRELNPTTRPNHTDIDENRDNKSGHQLLVFMDNTRRLWFYEPELHETGRHLFEVTNNASLFDPYFTETPSIELYEYVQILGKITPVVTPTGSP